jgi:DNA-binding transcriptional ArsR family regulator
MSGEPDLAVLGTLIGDPTRAMILQSLLNGGLMSASALAHRAKVSRPLASAHTRATPQGHTIYVLT